MDAHNSSPTQDKVTIRIATSNDVPLIESLIREEAVTRGEKEDTLPTIKQLLADGFESYPWFYYVLLAERGGAALGAALFHRVYWTWSGRTLRLGTLYVRPRARRAGLGRRLFLELCHLARLEEAQLDWEQPDDDQVAKAFFAPFRGIPNDLSDGVYSMLMDKEVIDYASKIDIQETEVFKTNEAVIVRLARRDDLTEIHNMILELAEFEGENITPQVTGNEFMKDAFGLSPWFFTLVAERAGQLIGLVIGNRIWRNRVRGLFAQTLFVSPRARRCGVAQKLMAQFCRMAAEQGVVVVEFHVFRENAPSLVLYRRLRAFDAPPLFAHAFRLTRDQLQQIKL